VRLCLGLYVERESLAWVNTNIFDYNRNMKHQAEHHFQLYTYIIVSTIFNFAFELGVALYQKS
jgi:hypothetical protein